MSLKDSIGADLKEAMKAKDQLRVETLRSVLSAFSYRKIDAGRELSDGELADVVRKQVKQRSDSMSEYERAGRADLFDRESHERDILSAYLPAQKDAAEIRSVVRAAIEALAPGERKEGNVMKRVMPALRGEADGATIRATVLEELKALGS